MFKRVFSKKNRALLAELVRTDFKLRYQGSVLGYAWSLLRPLFIFVIMYVVFVEFLKIGRGIPNYPVYLLLGIVLWNFFSEITNQSLGSIVGRSGLIRKIRIPRWIIILSSSFSALINVFLNLIVIGVFMLISNTQIQPTAIIIVPLLIIEMYLFGLGVSLFLATIYVKYRDVKYIWDVLMQAGFYATPIIYPLAIITNEMIQKAIIILPPSQVIQGARYQLVTDQTTTISAIYGNNFVLLVPFAVTGILLFFGTLYFRKESRYFAENI